MRPPARANSCPSSQAAARPRIPLASPHSRVSQVLTINLFICTHTGSASPEPCLLRPASAPGPPGPTVRPPPAPPPRTLPRALVAGQGPPSRPFSKHALHPPPGPALLSGAPFSPWPTSPRAWPLLPVRTLPEPPPARRLLQASPCPRGPLSPPLRPRSLPACLLASGRGPGRVRHMGAYCCFPPEVSEVMAVESPENIN